MRIADPSNHWATPRDLIAWLETIHGPFARQTDGWLFDPCPLANGMALFDGLKIDWRPNTFVNPPYSPQGKKAFVYKALEQAERGNTSVFLLPVSTSTELYHKIIKVRGEVTFLYGRPKYEGINSKGIWVNPNTADIRPEAREALELLGDRPSKASPGAHDAMTVVFRSFP